jgi:pimeloyl-ACP methyl ester carboxylesterase
LLLGCTAIPDAQERNQAVQALAGNNGWEKITLVAPPFELVAYGPKRTTPIPVLTVYIEGDGLAWLNRSTASSDPTPSEPLALKLALSHRQGTAVYLARPCQYLGKQVASCDQRYWTSARFAQEVIASTDQAISELKQRYGAREIVMVGYSGGAAVAALVAARRDDVIGLVTVAGNLDHRAWTQYHRVRPLSGSLNAVDVAPKLQSLPQVHLIGEDDQVIPPELARGWPAAFTGLNQSQLQVVPGYDHACCWVQGWPTLQPVPAAVGIAP